MASVKKNTELSPEQRRVLLEKGTEPAFCNAYWSNKRRGKYYCALCGALLFSSEAKYDSGTGWPSFFKPVDEKRLKLREDSALGMKRTEVSCAKCGGHLGHVFDDGPAPTHKRYCMNSAALLFEEDK